MHNTNSSLIHIVMCINSTYLSWLPLELIYPFMPFTLPLDDNDYASLSKDLLSLMFNLQI